MKPSIVIYYLYLLVILLIRLNGVLYPSGGIISLGLQMIMLLVSFYYTLYANMKYKLPLYFKALNILLVMFTVYGVYLILSGEEIIFQATLLKVSNMEYLRSIYISLFPIYPFFVFAKQGLLKEKTIRVWFFVFLVLAIRSFFRSQQLQLESAFARGSSREEFTINVGYTFAALMPALVAYYKRPIMQYLGLTVCSYFVLISMKRGAILIGAVCVLWFMVTNLRRTPKKKRWLVVAVSILVVFAGIYLVNYMMETSDYFRYRLAETEAGNSSGRNELYKTFFNHFINEDNPLRFLFGNGANATLKIGYNMAHNDWLEIAINQGLMGLIIYLIYWISFYISWKKTKNQSQAFMAIGMVFIVYFISTLFSMSYNCVSMCAAMVLGYYLAVSDVDVLWINKKPQL